LVRWWASTDERLKTIRGPRILVFFNRARDRRTLIPALEAIYFAAGDLRLDERYSMMLGKGGKRGLLEDRFPTGYRLQYGIQPGPLVDAQLVHELEVNTSEDGATTVKWMSPRLAKNDEGSQVIVWDIPGQDTVPPSALLPNSPTGSNH